MSPLPPSRRASFQASSVCVALHLCLMAFIDPCTPIHPHPSSTQTGSLLVVGVSKDSHFQGVFEKQAVFFFFNAKGRLVRRGTSPDRLKRIIEQIFRLMNTCFLTTVLIRRSLSIPLSLHLMVRELSYFTVFNFFQETWLFVRFNWVSRQNAQC